MAATRTAERGGRTETAVVEAPLVLAGAQAHELLKFFHEDETAVSGIDKVAERLRMAAFETLFTAFDTETLTAYLRQELKGTSAENTAIITIPTRPTFSPEAQVVEATLGNRKAQEQAFTVCFVQVDTFSCIYVFPWAGQGGNS